MPLTQTIPEEKARKEITQIMNVIVEAIPAETIDLFDNHIKSYNFQN